PLRRAHGRQVSQARRQTKQWLDLAPQLGPLGELFRHAVLVALEPLQAVAQKLGGGLRSTTAPEGLTPQPGRCVIWRERPKARREPKQRLELRAQGRVLRQQLVDAALSLLPAL